MSCAAAAVPSTILPSSPFILPVTFMRRSLKVEAIWASRRTPRFGLTVITQLSYDRMPALFNQCSTFTGPIAAAVYLPLIQMGESRRHLTGVLQPRAARPGGVLDGMDQGLSSANQERVKQEVARLAKLHEQ